MDKPHPIHSAIHLGPAHHAEDGRLERIGFYNGEIGIMAHTPADVRLPVIGLAAVGLDEDQISTYLQRRNPTRPDIGVGIHAAYSRNNLDDANDALYVVANAWRQRLLYVRQHITLPVEQAPGLPALPLSVKHVIRSLLTDCLACRSTSN